MTKTKETVVVEEFDENGKIIKRTTTTKESTQDDYYRPGDWWQNQPTVKYRGYTGDTITTTTTTVSNCDGQTCMDGFNVNAGDTRSETNGY